MIGFHQIIQSCSNFQFLGIIVNLLQQYFHWSSYDMYVGTYGITLNYSQSRLKPRSCLVTGVKYSVTKLNVQYSSASHVIGCYQNSSPKHVQGNNCLCTELQMRHTSSIQGSYYYPTTLSHWGYAKKAGQGVTIFTIT